MPSELEDDAPTDPDVFGPAHDADTPRVLVPAPDDPYLRGVVEALNSVYVYLQEQFELVGPDGGRVPMSASEAAAHVQAIRARVGV